MSDFQEIYSKTQDVKAKLKLSLAGVVGIVAGIALLATGGTIKLDSGNMKVPYWPWNGIGALILGTVILAWVLVRLVFAKPPSKTETQRDADNTSS